MNDSDKKAKQRARNRAYYLAHKEKMAAQVKGALERRLAAGLPRPISGWRPRPASDERKRYIKNANLMRNYGITLTEFQTLYGKQGGALRDLLRAAQAGPGLRRRSLPYVRKGSRAVMSVVQHGAGKL